jgi:FSR family fosmidomycin resistance protein-like MFS transporter
MSPATFRLVLLVSCAHALVHVYELAYPSVESLMRGHYQIDKAVAGQLGNTWRLPFGLGAMFVGLLVDRFGAKWLLVAYLLGCAATAGLIAAQPELPLLFGAMFLMGSFASVYHPAGLALISHETRPEHRPMALGYHGVLGSLGIAAAPFLAAACLSLMNNWWPGYYVVLTVPGVLLAVLIACRLQEHHRSVPRASDENLPPDSFPKLRFAVLTLSGALGGFVYAALMTFLPYYLRDLPWRPTALDDMSFRNYLTGVVLLIGMAGQYLAGRVARIDRLEWQLGGVLLAQAPLLVCMGMATGGLRVAAAGSVALVQFMQQPLYNGIVADYVPRHRRSLGYGISNTMAFGVGSFGAWYAGAVASEEVMYSSLAAFTVVSALLVLLLAVQRGRHIAQAAAPR